MNTVIFRSRNLTIEAMTGWYRPRTGKPCPKCQEQTVKYGREQYRGRQRYKCRKCGWQGQ